MLRFSLAFVVLTMISPTPAALAATPDNTLTLQLSTGGPVVIEMQPELAPKTVAHIKDLVRKKFYDGVVFHRVITGFMAQGGDPTGTGTGGSGQRIPGEFSKTARHIRGVVSMARTADPNSADSQFFIMYGDAPSLDNQYAIWGKVTKGMEFVDQLKQGDSNQNGVVDQPDKIVTARIGGE